MNPSTILVVLAGLTVLAYIVGRRRAVSFAAVGRTHSLSGYHGSYVALWCALPALVLLAAWQFAEPAFVRSYVLGQLPADLQALPAAQRGLVFNDIRNLVEGNIVSGEPSAAVLAAAERYTEIRALSRWILAVAVFALVLGAFALATRRLSPDFRARNHVERSIERLLMIASTVAIFTTIGIFLSVLFEAIRFFQQVSIFEFLFGMNWSPQTAIREDQVGSSGAFGAVPLFTGTLLISLLAMLVAVPVGLMSAIYLSEYADSRVRAYANEHCEQ